MGRHAVKDAFWTGHGGGSHELPAMVVICRRPAEHLVLQLHHEWGREMRSLPSRKDMPVNVVKRKSVIFLSSIAAGELSLLQ